MFYFFVQKNTLLLHYSQRDGALTDSEIKTHFKQFGELEDYGFLGYYIWARNTVFVQYKCAGDAEVAHRAGLPLYLPYSPETRLHLISETQHPVHVSVYVSVSEADKDRNPIHSTVHERRETRHRVPDRGTAHMQSKSEDQESKQVFKKFKPYPSVLSDDCTEYKLTSELYIVFSLQIKLPENVNEKLK